MKTYNLMLFVMSTLVLVSAASSQRTWRVNCAAGPNVDFTDLPPAVAAASPGDTIWLYADSTCQPGWSGYSGASIDKPLTIVGFYAGGAPGGNNPSHGLVRTALAVQNIPAGSRVSLSNLTLSWGTVYPPPQHGLDISNCAGQVVLEDINYICDGYSGSILRFDNCADVVMRGCFFGLSGHAIEVIDSTVLISNAFVQWFYPTLWNFGYHYTHNTESLLVRNSHVTLVDSTIFGPDELNVYPVANYYPQPAALVESGSLTIGPYCLLVGGAHCCGFENSVTVVNPAVAQVFVDPRAYPLLHSPGPPPFTRREVNVTWHDYVVGGENYLAVVDGPPNGWAMLAVGGGLLQPIPLGFGALAMDPASIAVLGLQQLDGQGRAVWTRNCPAVVPVGHVFAFQAAVLSPMGAISLTVPSPFTVGWPHGQIP